MKYKVMIAVDSYWPYQDGVSHVTQYIAEELAKREHEILVYTNMRGADLKEVETHNLVRIQRISVITQWPYYLKGAKKEYDPDHYYRQIETFQPDLLIVESIGNWPFDWLGKKVEELPCKKILHLHSLRTKENYAILDSLIRGDLKMARREYLLKAYWNSAWKIIQKYDLILHLYEGSDSYNYCKKYGINNNAVMENAVDDYFWQQDMYHNKKRSNNYQLLCVANYNSNKNQEMLLRAYQIARLRKQSRLIFVGNRETSYLDMMKSVSETIKSSTKDIVFYVNISREEVCRLYKEADVLVLPSKSEGSPVVLREAAATGMGIITTDVGDAQQIEGVSVVKNVQQMALAIEKYEDENIREEDGQIAYIWSKRHCNKKQKIDWLENRIGELINE